MKGKKIFLSLAIASYLLLLSVSLNFQEFPKTPWMLLRQGPFNFKPDLKIKMKMCGDLSLTKGIKELQDWREEAYTTDHYGFRNLAQIEDPRVVVLGDSYVVGIKLNDDQTLTYKMSRLLNEPVYNYGGQFYLAPAEFLADPRFQAHPPEIVIWAPVEYYINDFPLQATWKNKTLLDRWAELGADIKDFKYKLERDNYLTVLLKKLIAGVLFRIGFKLSSNTEIINVKGERKLVMSLGFQDLCLTPDERKFDQIVKNLVELNGLLEKRSVHFVFAPIPSTGSIYPEFFKNPCPQALAREGFLGLLLKEMQKNNIDHLDLKQPFSAKKYPYLYMTDDSHWNPYATDVAAQSLVDHIRPLLPEKSGHNPK